jgi:hypothetical protein
VRIVNIVEPIRDRILSSNYDPQGVPKIGQIGIIVRLKRQDRYLVERIDARGKTEWLCEFRDDEIEKVISA